MKKVVLLTYHYYNSRRKAGFHFLADSFKKKGFEVTFITSVASLLILIKRDYKVYEPLFFKNLLKPMYFNGIKSIINFSFLHPVSRGPISLENLFSLFFKLNSVSKKEINNADYIIFESTPALLFFQDVRKINPKAKLIYRMSDDLEVLKIARKVIEYEKEILKKFDLVSVPTKIMYDKYSKTSPNNVKLHFHGIDKELYDKCKLSPYKEGTINHVFVGNSYLDENFLYIASESFPNHLFHIIGAFKKNIKRKNVIYYGQMLFEKTIPYVKFASTGLQIRSNIRNAAKTLADSLKVLQYTYCKLPIIAPSVIPAHHRKNFFYYEYDNKDSIRRCIENALNFDKNIFCEDIYSWDELIEALIND